MIQKIIEACPINPSDLFLAYGNYGVTESMKKGSIGVGFEGAGIVTQVSWNN